MTNDEFIIKMKADLKAAVEAKDKEAAKTLRQAIKLWNNMTGMERRRFRRDNERRRAAIPAGK